MIYVPFRPGCVDEIQKVFIFLNILQDYEVNEVSGDGVIIINRISGATRKFMFDDKKDQTFYIDKKTYQFGVE